MIFERSDSLLRYAGAIPGLKAVSEVIASGVLESAAIGSYTTSDPDVGYAISEYEPKGLSDDTFEFHYRYMDVQVMVKGSESCFYSPEKADFSLIPEGKDIAFQSAKTYEECFLSEGMAVIYFPGELHKPGVKKSDGLCRKVVFKVRIN